MTGAARVKFTRRESAIWWACVIGGVAGIAAAAGAIVGFAATWLTGWEFAACMVLAVGVVALSEIYGERIVKGARDRQTAPTMCPTCRHLTSGHGIGRTISAGREAITVTCMECPDLRCTAR